MGLLDKLLKIKKDKKEFERGRKEQINLANLKKENCVHDWTYVKVMGYGPVMGKVIHYKRKCRKCKRSHFIPRNKQNYEKVKNINWTYSKSYKKLKN